MLSIILIGCQNEEAESEEENTNAVEESSEGAHEEHDHSHENQEGEIIIEGLAHHYHTGDSVSLTAEHSVDSDDEHWHWSKRDENDEDWEVIEGQYTDTLELEEAVHGQQIKASLYDDDHNEIAESDSVTITIDDHEGDVYEGYFEDSQVEDREVSDWSGNWKSVYPHLENGDLDEVFEEKAENSDEMNAEEYKEYYEAGYKTNVDKVDISEEGEFTFHEGNEEYSGSYVYDGYEILEYEAGNRGVRYIFELEDGNEKAPQYIQFSDHVISPQKSGHFHLYWGDDREQLLEEVINWPTYYPEDMEVEEIKDDMLLH